jgi:FKBP-type peptidyl-prolyl cis-trans isomerase 2
MTNAKQGDTVKVHYTGKLDDGTVFDTTTGRDPLEFTIGEGRIIPGFEHAVVGMTPGESKTAKIDPEDAYGTHNPERVQAVDRSQFPENISPEVGQQLRIVQESGQTFIVTVLEVNDSDVLLDTNHPLAGKQLTFDIGLEEIV